MTMHDLSHDWGADLELTAGGDIRATLGIAKGRQRIIRRLLTAPGGYLWDLDYGAGLGRFVGRPRDANRIQAVVQAQLRLEDTVSREVKPQVTVMPAVNGNDGRNCVLEIRYAAGETSETALLTLRVGS